MKSLITTLCFTFITVCLSSCSNDEDTFDKKQYELDSVTWSQQDGDKRESYEVSIQERTFSNSGTETNFITIPSFDGINETSKFYIDEEIQRYLSEESLVSIPCLTSSLSLEYKIISGDKEVSFQTEEVILPPKESSDKLSIAPNCQLTYSAKIKMKKITATYRAHFVEKNGSDSFDVEGKWEGRFIERSEFFITHKDIQK